MVRRRLWFMGRPLPVRQKLVRLWRTGTCTFSDVTVNEHPLVTGRIGTVRGDLEHLDSPDLQHWRHKQDRSSTAEAWPLFARPRFGRPEPVRQRAATADVAQERFQPLAVSARADIRPLPFRTGRLARGSRRRHVGAGARKCIG